MRWRHRSPTGSGVGSRRANARPSGPGHRAIRPAPRSAGSGRGGHPLGGVWLGGGGLSPVTGDLGVPGPPGGGLLGQGRPVRARPGCPVHIGGASKPGRPGASPRPGRCPRPAAGRSAPSRPGAAGPRRGHWPPTRTPPASTVGTGRATGAAAAWAAPHWRRCPGGGGAASIGPSRRPTTAVGQAGCFVPLEATSRCRRPPDRRSPATRPPPAAARRLGLVAASRARRRRPANRRRATAASGCR
jgi:hypothetical protein